MTVVTDFGSKACGVKVSAKLFEILSSSIYTRPVEAVIREISCNANDAQKGVDRPFEVHLPTRFDNTFWVRDFGPGLSPDEINHVYTTYFESTKEGDELSTGELGLGSKSPLALNESFLVESYHNGIKTVYSIFKNDEGEPRVSDPIIQEPSSEPSGLCVKVDATGMRHKFQSAAIRVFKYFEKMPKINDQEVVDKVTKWKDSIDITTDSYGICKQDGELLAVMGNVAYSIPSEISLPPVSGYIKFNNKDLPFEPGRESIRYTEAAEAKFKQKIAEITAKLAQDLKAEIETKKTDFKKKVYFQSLESRYFKKIIKDNPDMFSEYVFPTIPDEQEPYTIYGSHGDLSRFREFPGRFYNVKVVRKEKGHGGRVKAYAKQHRVRVMYLTDDQIKFFGIDPEYILDATTLPKPAHAKYSSARVFKYKGTGHYRAPSNWEEVDIDTTQENVYVEISRYRPVNSDVSLTSLHSIVRHLETLGIDVEIIGIKSSLVRQKRFSKWNMISLSDFLRREIPKQPPRKIVKYSGDFRKELKKVGLTQVDDYLADKQISRNPLDSFLKVWGGRVDTDLTADTIEANLLEKYPLLKMLLSSYRFHRHLDEIKHYISLIDKETQNGTV